MLEKPPLPDARLARCLQEAFALSGVQVTFLPLGADPDAAVYRAVAPSGAAYFVKLRRGTFNSIAVLLPYLLNEHGVEPIITPCPRPNGSLWATLDDYTVIVYPYVYGKNAYEVALSPPHWAAFGTALKRLHSLTLPPVLVPRIAPETYAADARQQVMGFLASLDSSPNQDAPARALLHFLHTKHDALHALVTRTEQLAQRLQASPLPCVLCHGDLHAGNLLVSDNNQFYIVDWDAPVFAPRERDLMFLGHNQAFLPQEAEPWFYATYGAVDINPFALAYYRYERIVQDIAAFCEQVLLSSDGDEDRTQAVEYVKWNFVPGGTLEAAVRADPAPPAGIP